MEGNGPEKALIQSTELYGNPGKERLLRGRPFSSCHVGAINRRGNREAVGLLGSVPCTPGGLLDSPRPRMASPLEMPQSLLDGSEESGLDRGHQSSSPTASRQRASSWNLVSEVYVAPNSNLHVNEDYLSTFCPAAVRENKTEASMHSSKAKEGMRKNCTKTCPSHWLRALLRHLLAGTGWIMEVGICRDAASELIKTLLGEDVASRIRFDPLYAFKSRPQSREEKTDCSATIAEIVSCYLGIECSKREAEILISQRRGPYKLSERFREILNGRPWPPCCPSNDVLRRYGCRRLGETNPKRGLIPFIVPRHQQRGTMILER